MEQEQKALQERIENGEDVVVDNPTDGEERLIEMNVGLVAGGDNAESGDWTEDSGELVDFRAFRGYAFFSILIYLERNKTRESDYYPLSQNPIRRSRHLDRGMTITSPLTAIPIAQTAPAATPRAAMAAAIKRRHPARPTRLAKGHSCRNWEMAPRRKTRLAKLQTDASPG